MTLGASDLQSYIDLDSIRNSCDVVFMRTIFSGGRADVDEAKLEKLLKRQKIYGDITQVCSEREGECCVRCKLSSSLNFLVFFVVGQQGALGGSVEHLQQ